MDLQNSKSKGFQDISFSLRSPQYLWNSIMSGHTKRWKRRRCGLWKSHHIEPSEWELKALYLIALRLLIICVAKWISTKMSTAWTKQFKKKFKYLKMIFLSLKWAGERYMFSLLTKLSDVFSTTIPQVKQLEMTILAAVWWNVSEIVSDGSKLSLLSIFFKRYWIS